MQLFQGRPDGHSVPRVRRSGDGGAAEGETRQQQIERYNREYRDDYIRNRAAGFVK